jgi:hypothetical protein
MPNAPKLLILLALLPAIAGCHKEQAQQTPDPNIVGIDNDAGTPTDVDTLPPDESSATPSNQLVNGDDSPDVNDTSTNNSD